MDRRPVGVAESLEVACGIASALQACHRRGLVHCDIKPANVVLRTPGAKSPLTSKTPVLIDFGIATKSGSACGGGRCIMGAPK